jgi:hypothetical protein
VSLIDLSEELIGKMGLKWMSLISGFLALQFLGGLLCMARGKVLEYDFVVSTFFFFLELIFGCNLLVLCTLSLSLSLSLSLLLNSS